MEQKNDIKVGDIVAFLYDYDIFLGKVLKVNKTTYKIDIPSQKACIALVKNVKKEKVANIHDMFSVVWESSKGPRGSYRIDYTTYPQSNSNYKKWRNTNNYIIE